MGAEGTAAPLFLVDDEPDALQGMALTLQAHGLGPVRRIQDPRLVLELLREEQPDCVVLDLTMPQLSGEEVLAHIRTHHPEVPVVVVTGVDLVASAVHCMRLGALDYLVKPVDEQRLIASLRRVRETMELSRENRVLREAMVKRDLSHPEVFERILTASPALLGVFRYVEAVAPSSQPVLITGETGTGKELLARAVHDASARPGEFVAVNVAGLDDQLFADTLFGHRKGAFTGAEGRRAGLIEAASDGTLFLDEIGDLAIPSQVKLLRLLQEHEYFPLGSDVAKRSKARIVCATHQDLQARQAAGDFRKDLFYRLRAHHVEIPPLRDRREDLSVLLRHFLVRASADLERPVPTPPPEIYDLLGAYSFPGNVRELEALVYDAVSRHRGGILSLDTFRAAVRSESGTATIARERPSAPPAASAGVTFGEHLPSLKEVQDALVGEAIARCGGNQSAAAAMLGVSRQALNKRLRK